MLIGIIIGVSIVAIIGWASCNDILFETLFTLLLVGGIVSCHQSEWYQAEERVKEAARAVQDKADATPHVIREADGCKVYAFKAGQWHYFTRCEGGTITESHHTETTGSGKHANNVDVVEIIPQSTK